MLGAEEAYRLINGSPNYYPGAIDELHRGQDQSRETQKWMAEENANMAAAPYRAFEKGAGQAIQQYAPGYERAYTAERDSQREGRAAEEQGWNRESHGWDRDMQPLRQRQAAANAGMSESQALSTRINAEEAQKQSSMLDTPGVGGKTARQSRFDTETQAGLLGNQATQAGITATNVGTQIAKAGEGRAAGNYATTVATAAEEKASRTLAATIAQGGDAKDQDRVLAQFGGDPQAQARVTMGAKQIMNTSKAANDTVADSTPQGILANEQAAHVNDKISALGKLVEAKKAQQAARIGSTSQADAERQAQDALTKLGLHDHAASVGGQFLGVSVGTEGITSGNQRLEKAYGAAKASVENEIAQLKSQAAAVNSTRLQGQIQALEMRLQQLDQNAATQGSYGKLNILGGGGAQVNGNAGFFQPGRVPSAGNAPTGIPQQPAGQQMISLPPHTGAAPARMSATFRGRQPTVAGGHQ